MLQLLGVCGIPLRATKLGHGEALICILLLIAKDHFSFFFFFSCMGDIKADVVRPLKDFAV